MRILRQHKFLALLIAAIFFASCHKKDAIVAELSVSSSEEVFTADGGTSEVTVTSNTNWSISNSTSWLTATASTSNGDGKISLNIQSNPTASERSALISVTAGNISKEIKVRQLAKATSDSVPADATGMSSNAVQLAAKIKLG